MGYLKHYKILVLEKVLIWIYMPLLRLAFIGNIGSATGKGEGGGGKEKEEEQEEEEEALVE
ncbi:MAG TPA: hypothetical protein VF233_10990 [Nitrososphaeraceae archaeon]